MNELIGWLIVVGLAVTAAAIYMLSLKIENQTRTILEFLLHSNEMVVARLEQARAPLAQGEWVSDGAPHQERRRRQRRNPLTSLLCASGGTQRGTLPRRRLEDLVQS